jgi:hypothetical protein
MEYVFTPVRKRGRSLKKWLWIPVVYLAISHWDIALPTVTIHYPESGKEELRYIWNVQDRVYKGGMQPGGGTVDNGHLFPDDKFFMEISWWSKNVRAHCVNITPKWPNTDIYLDANGDIDLSETSGTDLDRLKQCITDTARP